MLKVFNALLDVNDIVSEHDADSEVSYGCHVAWAVTGADGGAVLSEYEVLPVVEFVFDLPVGAIEGEEHCGIGTLEGDVSHYEHCFMSHFPRAQVFSRA